MFKIRHLLPLADKDTGLQKILKDKGITTRFGWYRVA